MYILAVSQSSPHAVLLGLVVCLAMIGSCAISGISGALVPLTLKRLGADPGDGLEHRRHHRHRRGEHGAAAGPRHAGDSLARANAASERSGAET